MIFSFVFPSAIKLLADVYSKLPLIQRKHTEKLCSSNLTCVNVLVSSWISIFRSWKSLFLLSHHKYTQFLYTSRVSRITPNYFLILCLNTFNHSASSFSLSHFIFLYIRVRSDFSFKSFARSALHSFYFEFYHFFNFFADFSSSSFFLSCCCCCCVFSLSFPILCLVLAQFWINKFEYLHRAFSQTFRFGNFLFFVYSIYFLFLFFSSFFHFRYLIIWKCAWENDFQLAHSCYSALPFRSLSILKRVIVGCPASFTCSSIFIFTVYAQFSFSFLPLFGCVCVICIEFVDVLRIDEGGFFTVNPSASFLVHFYQQFSFVYVRCITRILT